MFSSRYFSGCIVVAVVIFAALFVSGCADDPENAASNELRASCESARFIVTDSRAKARKILRDGENSAKDADPANAAKIIIEAAANAHQEIKKGFQQAYSKVDSALARHSRSASKRTINVAALTAANILFSQAEELKLLLGNYRIQAEAVFDEITKASRKFDTLQGQKNVLETLLTGVQQQASSLEKVLENGVAGNPALITQLNSERARLNELLQQKAQFDQKITDRKAAANEIEANAGAMLKEAEFLTNSIERLKLEKEAFSLLLTKKDHLRQYQSAVDALEIVESKILISQQMVEKYDADVKAFSGRIDAIKSSSRQADLQKQSTQINKQLNQYRQKIENLLDQLSNKRKIYTDSLQEIAELFEKALADYDKAATSSKVRDFANERKSSCRLWLGTLYSSSVRFHEELMLRMRFVTDTPAITASGGLSGIMRQCSQTSADHRKKTYDNFDLAAEGFGALTDGGEFAAVAIKSNILALYGKAELAAYLGGVASTDQLCQASYVVSDEAMDKASKLLPRAEELDPGFAKSITARLLAGDGEFVPQMEVDLTGYYEDIRSRQFGNWAKLKGQEKIRRINYLLDLIASMEPAKDPAAFDQIIRPEKRLMEDALKAPIEIKKQGTGRRGNDPNS